jgi:hypothetical protein
MIGICLLPSQDDELERLRQQVRALEERCRSAEARCRMLEESTRRAFKLAAW